jgi:hypothetical protein
MSPFSDELTKIATSGMTPEDKEELKQFLKNTGVIMAGTGAGLGAHALTRIGLEKAFGPRGRWPGKIGPRALSALAATVPTALGVGSLYGYSQMRKREKELREQARQRARNVK